MKEHRLGRHGPVFLLGLTERYIVCLRSYATLGPHASDLGQGTHSDLSTQLSQQGSNIFDENLFGHSLHRLGTQWLLTLEKHPHKW